MQIRCRTKAALAFILAGATTALGAKVEALGGLDFGRLEAREVRVFVPAEGVTPATPVLIALDGQNLAAWRLEEALTGIAAQGRRAVPLVVAISSGKDRLDEYGLAGTPDFAGRGEGQW